MCRHADGHAIFPSSLQFTCFIHRMKTVTATRGRTEVTVVFTSLWQTDCQSFSRRSRSRLQSVFRNTVLTSESTGGPWKGRSLGYISVVHFRIILGRCWQRTVNFFSQNFGHCSQTSTPASTGTIVYSSATLIKFLNIKRLIIFKK